MILEDWSLTWPGRQGVTGCGMGGEGGWTRHLVTNWCLAACHCCQHQNQKNALGKIKEMRWKLFSKCKSTSSVDIDIWVLWVWNLVSASLFIGHSCSCFAGRCLTSHGYKQFRMHVCVLGLHTFWADRVPVANSKGSKALLTEVAFWYVFFPRGVGVHADMAGTGCSFLRHEWINNKRIRFGRTVRTSR